MAEFEQKILTGVLFTNNYKDKDSQPDLKGKLRLSEEETIKLSGWKKVDKNGNDYISLSVDTFVPQKQEKDPEDDIDF